MSFSAGGGSDETLSYYIRAFDLATPVFRAFGTEVEATTRRVQTSLAVMNREMAAQSAETSKMARGQAELSARQAVVQRESVATGTALSGMGGKTRAATTEIDKHAKGLREAGYALSGFSGQLGPLGRSLDISAKHAQLFRSQGIDYIAAGLVGLTAATVGYGIKAAASFGQLSRSMQMQAGTSSKVTQQLLADVKQVATESPAAYKTIGAAVAAQAKLFGDNNALIKENTDLYIAFADRAQRDVVPSITAISSIMRQFHPAGMTTVDVMDQLVNLAQKSQRPLSGYLDVLSRYGPQLTAMGLSFTQTIGLFDAFSQHGITAQQMGRGLASALSIAEKQIKAAGAATADGGAKLEQYKLAFDSAQIRVNTLRTSLQAGKGDQQKLNDEMLVAQGRLDLAKQKMDGYTAALKHSGDAHLTVSQVISREAGAIENAKSKSDALNLSIAAFGTRLGPQMAQALYQNKQGLDVLDRALGTAHGATENLAKAQRDSLHGQLEILKHDFTNIAAEVGQVAIPPLRGFVHLLGDVTKAIAGLPKGALEGILGTGAALGAATLLMRHSPLGGAVASATGAQGGLAAFLTGKSPTGQAIAGIGGGAGGIYGLGGSLIRPGTLGNPIAVAMVEGLGAGGSAIPVGGAGRTAAAAEQGALARGETQLASGVVLPAGVRAPAAAAAGEAALATGAGEVGLLASLRGGASAALPVLGAAGMGLMVGSTVQQATGLRGGAAGTLGGGAAGAGIGAALGSVVPGLGTAIGAGLGAAVGSTFGPAVVHELNSLFGDPSYGQKLAGSLTKGFGGAAAPDLKKQVAHLLDEANNLVNAAPARPPGKDFLSKGFPPPTGADIAKAGADYRKAGKLIAQQLEAGWAQYKFQSEPVILSQFTAETKNLPPQAKAAALESAVAFSKQLEASGQLTKGSTQMFIASVEQEFPALKQFMGLTATASAQTFAKALDFSQTETKLKAQMNLVGNDFAGVRQAAINVGGSTQQQAAAMILSLQDIVNHGTGPMRKQAEADLRTLKASFVDQFTAAAGVTTAKMTDIQTSVSSGSKGALDAANTYWTQYVQVVQGAEQAGVITVGQGNKIIAQELAAAMQALGIPAKDAQALASSGFTLQQATQGFGGPGTAPHGGHFAGGGWVPGDPHSDGTLIAAAGNEFVMTGPGQSMLESMAPGMLDYIAANQAPHFHGGGFVGVPAFKAGGSVPGAQGGAGPPIIGAHGGVVGGGNVWEVRTSQELASSGSGWTELSPNGNAAARLGIPRSFSNNPGHYPDFASLGQFFPNGTLSLKIRGPRGSGTWNKTDSGDGSSFAPAIGLTPAVSNVTGGTGGTVQITRADGGNLHLFPGMGTLVSGSGGFAAGAAGGGGGAGGGAGVASALSWTDISVPAVVGSGGVAALAQGALAVEVAAINAAGRAAVAQGKVPHFQDGGFLSDVLVGAHTYTPPGSSKKAAHHTAAHPKAKAAPKVAPIISAGGLVTMYDATAGSIGSIPGNAGAVASYMNNHMGYSQAKARFPNVPVLSINVDPPSDMSAADVLDVELGGHTPNQSGPWAASMIQQGRYPRLYTTRSQRAAVQASLAAHNVSRSKYGLWIAAPTGTPHMEPGTDATQYKFAGAYDVSLAKPSFFTGVAGAGASATAGGTVKSTTQQAVGTGLTDGFDLGYAYGLDPLTGTDPAAALALAIQGATLQAAAPVASATTPTTAATATGITVKGGASGGASNTALGRMVADASAIASHGYNYEWGGGHNSSFAPTHGTGHGSGPGIGYDCSGAVSSVLHAGGLLGSPQVAAGFMGWGASGPGQNVTVYAGPSHTFMKLQGRYFGTSGQNPGGGANWIPNFPENLPAVRHPQGFRRGGFLSNSWASTLPASEQQRQRANPAAILPGFRRGGSVPRFQKGGHVSHASHAGSRASSHASGYALGSAGRANPALGDMPSSLAAVGVASLQADLQQMPILAVNIGVSTSKRALAALAASLTTISGTTDTAKITAAMGQLSGALDNVGAVSYATLQRTAAAIEKQIADLTTVAHKHKVLTPGHLGGWTGPSRPGGDSLVSTVTTRVPRKLTEGQQHEVDRLNQALQLVQYQEGVRVGTLVKTATDQAAAIATANSRLQRLMARKGVSTSSVEGAQMLQAFDDQAVTVLKNSIASLQKAYKLAAKAKDKKAMADISGRLTSALDQLDQAVTDAALQRVADIKAKAQSFSDKSTQIGGATSLLQGLQGLAGGTNLSGLGLSPAVLATLGLDPGQAQALTGTGLDRLSTIKTQQGGVLTSAQIAQAQAGAGAYQSQIRAEEAPLSGELAYYQSQLPNLQGQDKTDAVNAMLSVAQQIASLEGALSQNQQAVQDLTSATNANTNATATMTGSLTFSYGGQNYTAGGQMTSDDPNNVSVGL